MKTTFLKKEKNSIQDSVENDENGYSVPDPNKTMINVSKEPVAHKKKPLKDEILEESLRNSQRRY
jgi:hypothetical protein